MKIWELEQKKGPYQIKEKKVIKKKKNFHYLYFDNKAFPWQIYNQ